MHTARGDGVPGIKRRRRDLYSDGVRRLQSDAVTAIFLYTARGDGVPGIKRRRRDLSSDGIRSLATASGRGRLKDDLESSAWRRRHDFKATPSQVGVFLMVQSQGYSEPAVMSSTTSVVTYIFVYTDSKPGRVFWGAGEEISDRGSPRVIMYGYDRLPIQPVAPPSPDYIPDSDEPQIPPVPQDEDEQREDGDDDDGDSFGDDADDEDEDERDEDDEDEEEEEEHLALTDSAVIVPIVELVSPHAEGNRAVSYTHPPLSLLPLDAGSHLSPPSVKERHLTCSRYKIGESSTARPIEGRGIDYGFVSTVDAEARRQGISEVGYGIRDTWVDPAEAVPEIAHMTMGEVNTGVTELAELHERDTHDLYALLEDAQDGRTRISQRVAMDSQRVDLAMGDMMTLQETIWIMEEEAYASRKAWAHSIGLSQATHQELQTT
ncbi:hypothetical protein Tco_0940039 [Tanacetum coccineum]|uniref:Uncharacterized protein n=1 Tax=Tanacetum coccineum TaxID=301880 RepID=A0ABQ5DMG2_9ASTR